MMVPDVLAYPYSRYVLIGIVVLIAVFALSRSYLRLKNGNESLLEFILWTVLWLLILLVVIFPDITGFPAKLLGIGRGTDVLVYFGLVFLFYSIFRVYSKIEKIEQEITKLTREIALANHPKDARPSLNSTMQSSKGLSSKGKREERQTDTKNKK